MDRYQYASMNRTSTREQERQVCFVLTSTGKDVYMIMARLAVASVRMSDRTSKVLLLCDERTLGRQEVRSSPLLAEVDQVISVRTPDGDPAFRSRHMKTTMRRQVQGDLLFLDLDVIVRGGLDEVFCARGAVAAAVNHSLPTIEEQVWSVTEEMFGTMGWQHHPAYYLNSGVVLLRDQPEVHVLCEDWHRKWQDSWKRTGRHYDQPALNAALHHSGVSVVVLHDRFNAQFRMAPSVARDAVIWHYYASEKTDYLTAYGRELTRLQDGGEFDLVEVRRLVSASHPWRRHSFLDDLVADHAMRLGRLDKWHVEWFKGQRWKALRSRWIG